jgi:hypothetical protein
MFNKKKSKKANKKKTEKDVPAFVGSSGSLCEAAFDIAVIPCWAFIIRCPFTVSCLAFLGWFIGVGFSMFACNRTAVWMG